MILIITNRSDQTADYLILELKKREAEYIRFNTEDFPQKISLNWEIADGMITGYLNFPKRKVFFSEIKSAWYRRPVSPTINPKIVDSEAQNFAIEESRTALEGLWKTLPCFWVSHPDNIRIAENKMYQLQEACNIGFIIWPTVVTNDVYNAREFYYKQDEKIVYKPLKKSKLIREDKSSLIFTNLIQEEHIQYIDRVKYSPALMQKYIDKKVELRVTVIGNESFAVAIDSQKFEDTKHDWRRGASEKSFYTFFDLPIDIKDKCVNLTKKLGLRFGAIDLILTPKNEYIFLEINPNGQWAWLQQSCPEIPLRERLADLLINNE